MNIIRLIYQKWALAVALWKLGKLLQEGQIHADTNVPAGEKVYLDLFHKGQDIRDDYYAKYRISEDKDITMAMNALSLWAFPPRQKPAYVKVLVAVIGVAAAGWVIGMFGAFTNVCYHASLHIFGR